MRNRAEDQATLVLVSKAVDEILNNVCLAGSLEELRGAAVIKKLCLIAQAWMDSDAEWFEAAKSWKEEAEALAASQYAGLGELKTEYDRLAMINKELRTAEETERLVLHARALRAIEDAGYFV